MKKKIHLDHIPSCNECQTSKLTLFNELPHEELDVLSESKGKNLFKKGQVIFYEGNHAHGLYCIFQGKVKLHKIGGLGKEQIVRFAKTGDLLGYRSLLSNQAYSATATALEDCYVCHIPKNVFLEILDENNKLSCKVSQLLAKDLKNSEDKIVTISQKPVRERIAEALLILKEKFAVEDDDKTLNISLTRKEIGNIAGVTTETTIRVLSEFNKENIVSLKGKKIMINNLPVLLKYANLID